MAYDLTPHLEPSRCALIVFECQEGVIGERSQLVGLARAVRDGHVLDHIATLLDAARASGARVFYCSVQKRADGVGNPFATPLEMRMREAQRAHGGPAGAPDMGEIVAEIAPRTEAGDIVVHREHGMTGFYESGLDAYLRNTGVRTIVLCGVSVNVGVLGTAIEAVNRGYTVVVPTDCVAGDPPEYAEQALRYSVRNVAFLTTSQAVAEIWKG